MKIAVSGGRNYDDRVSMARSMAHAVSTMRHRMGTKEKITLIHGGATGADTLSHRWADHMNANGVKVDVIIVEADWKTWGRSAGQIRNIAIADMVPDLWVFFPGGPGTRHARKIAVERGIQVMDVNPNDANSPRPAGLT